MGRSGKTTLSDELRPEFLEAGGTGSRRRHWWRRVRFTPTGVGVNRRSSCNPLRHLPSAHRYGVNRGAPVGVRFVFSLPHAGGGEPGLTLEEMGEKLSVPRR